MSYSSLLAPWRCAQARRPKTSCFVQPDSHLPVGAGQTSPCWPLCYRPVWLTGELQASDSSAEMWHFPANFNHTMKTPHSSSVLCSKKEKGISHNHKRGLGKECKMCDYIGKFYFHVNNTQIHQNLAKGRPAPGS